jgi:alpha-glucoside transport system ATP-binding protein
MNILPGKVTATGAKTSVEIGAGRKVELPIASDASLKGSNIQFGVRPEDLTVTKSANWIIEGEVTLVECLGEVTLLYLDSHGSEEPVIAKLTGTHNLERGTKVHLSAPAKTMHAFTEDGISLRHI